MSAYCGHCGQFYDVVEENFEGGWDALKVGVPLFVTTLVGILTMINRWESHSSLSGWLDPSSWSSIRGKGTPQNGGELFNTCSFVCF